MRRIDELIRELCPDGVMYCSLSEIATISTGSRPTDQDLQSGGDLQYLNGGVELSGRLSLSNTSGDTVSIPSRGSVGVVTYQANDFWCGPLRYRVRASGASITNRFLYFYLKSSQDRVIALQQTGSIPAINKSQLARFLVPVPPLEVQREIVRILDTFTELEAELEGELEARRVQFAHYRNTLLTFPEGAGVQWIPMGELVEIRSGWGFPNAHQGHSDGELPFYKVGDMNRVGNETAMSTANNYVSAEVARKLRVKPAPAGTIIFPKIGAAVATNKKRVLSIPAAYDNNVMGLIPGPQIASRFLFHWMHTFNLVKLANDSGAVPSIRKSEAERVLVPVPHLLEQARISDLLDRFDFLVHSLTDGLPAEIAARRRQYEYYREKLLTFEELAS